MLSARLSGLTEATIRISENLDLDVVLQEVADSARALTGARYSAITTLDDAGDLQDVLLSGLTAEEEQTLLQYPSGWELLEYLTGMRGPLRTSDFVAHAESAGFSGFQPRIDSFLGAQVRVGDRHVGTVYIGEKQDGAEFTDEDEKTLEMFATQAALAITNARHYGDERRAKADLEALVNMSPVGVLVVKATSGVILMANREARRILGIQPGEARDPAPGAERLNYRRMDGSEVPFEALPVQRAMRQGETVQAEELVIRRVDGSEVVTLVNAAPVRAEDGEYGSVVVTIQDMTPLEDLERLRTEFLAMVSHELRAPLTSIKGAAASVRDSPSPLDPSEVTQIFRVVEDRADHMRDLIRDLLDMTRIEAGTLSVSPEPMDLASVIDQAKNAFLGGGHRHNVDVEPIPSLPPVWADRQRIVQVLHTLFSNAAAQSREWSTITVAVSSDDTHAAITVTDEGAGLSPELLPLLFTKFSPIQRGHSRRGEAGYGLGLVICKGIVEAHGGRIWAHSDGEGHGSRFTFTLPVLDEPATPAAPPEPSRSDAFRAPSGVERVLVIDDDLQALRYVRNTLARAGYTPIVTSDPNELNHLLETAMPHLLLLDPVLPDTDGFKLVKQIPKTLEVPVVILSGRGDDQQVARAFELGAADFIAKPFSPTELLARVAAALRRSALARQVEPYRMANLVVDYVTRTVTVAGRTAKLTPTEYNLLSELCTDAGRTLTYDQLLERVWDEGSGGEAQRVRSLVRDLRAKLGDDARNPTYILTVPGVGYQAATPE